MIAKIRRICPGGPFVVLNRRNRLEASLTEALGDSTGSRKGPQYIGLDQPFPQSIRRSPHVIPKSNTIFVSEHPFRNYSFKNPSKGRSRFSASMRRPGQSCLRSCYTCSEQCLDFPNKAGPIRQGPLPGKPSVERVARTMTPQNASIRKSTCS